MQARERRLLELHHWHGDAPSTVSPGAPHAMIAFNNTDMLMLLTILFLVGRV